MQKFTNAKKNDNAALDGVYGEPAMAQQAPSPTFTEQSQITPHKPSQPSVSTNSSVLLKIHMPSVTPPQSTNLLVPFNIKNLPLPISPLPKDNHDQPNSSEKKNAEKNHKYTNWDMFADQENFNMNVSFHNYFSNNYMVILPIQ